MDLKSTEDLKIILEGQRKYLSAISEEKSILDPRVTIINISKCVKTLNEIIFAILEGIEEGTKEREGTKKEI